MTVEYIRYKIEQSNTTAFLEAYTKAAKSLDQSDYCMAYELTQCEEEPEQFILRIEWTSTDEHLNGFRKSPQFSEFFSHIRPYIKDIQEMRHYRQTTIASQTKSYTT